MSLDLERLIPAAVGVDLGDGPMGRDLSAEGGGLERRLGGAKFARDGAERAGEGALNLGDLEGERLTDGPRLEGVDLEYPGLERAADGMDRECPPLEREADGLERDIEPLDPRCIPPPECVRPADAPRWPPPPPPPPGRCASAGGANQTKIPRTMAANANWRRKPNFVRGSVGSAIFLLLG